MYTFGNKSFVSSQCHKIMYLEKAFDPVKSSHFVALRFYAKEGILRPELWGLTCLQFWFLYFHYLQPFLEIIIILLR